MTDRHPHVTGEPLLTDARRAGAPAADAGQRYGEVLALSADMLTAHDEEGRYVYVSPACERIYGRPPEELLGRHPLEFVHEDDRERVEREIARALAAHGAFEVEHRVLRPDGTCAWVHAVIRMASESPGEGRRIGAVGSVRDITERKHAQAQYDAERRLLNIFLESTPDQVYFKDRDGRFIRVSNAEVAKLGFSSAQDAIGKTDFDAFSQEHAREAHADEQRILASGEPILDLEERETYPDGSEAWVRSSKLPLRDAAGQVIGTFGISRDITAQRAAEEALIETERELRTVLELSGDLHVRTAADGRLLYVSPNSARVIGWTPEQLLGTRTEDYAHPHDAARLRATYREVAETGSAEVEYRVRRPDGTYTWLHVLARGRHDVDGNLVEVVRAARNIDQQKRQETQLAEATRRFERAFDQAPIGMALVGLDGSWLKVNPALCQITGYSEAELLHKRFDDITHPDDRQAGIKQLERQRRGELDIYEAEKRYIRADGQVIWVALSASIVRDEHGRALYAVSQTQDITAAKQAAAERKRLEAELHLAQKLEAVGQLAAGVAHEINTPIQFVGDSVRFLKEAVDELLTLANVYRDLLQSEQAIDRAQRLQRAAAAEQESDLGYLIERVPPAFERAVDGIDRVASIVQAMRQFAHPGAERGPTDINDGIRATLTVARNEYKYVADIELDLGELPLLTANAGDLNQVFLNLIVNGAHAIESKLEDSGQRGTIRISTRADGDHVSITVSDTGCGIPPAIAARVFDPFFTTKPVGRGTGQGLAIAHTIVAERHHGAISFKSAPGGGTTFEITLPIDEPAAPSTASCSEP